MKNIIILFLTILSCTAIYGQTAIDKEVLNLIPFPDINSIKIDVWPTGDTIKIQTYVERFDESVGPTNHILNDSIGYNSLNRETRDIIAKAKDATNDIIDKKRKINKVYDDIIATLYRLSKYAYTQNHWENHKDGKDEILWTMQFKEGNMKIKFMLSPVEETQKHPELLWMLPKSSGCVEAEFVIAEPIDMNDENSQLNLTLKK